MAGTILGSVIAVMMVIYMNKTIVNKHMNIKSRKRQMGSPSLIPLDDDSKMA